MKIATKKTLQLLTDPKSKTFGNATQSYAATHPAASYPTAKREASRLLARPEIKSEIERILDEQGLSDPELGGVLASIVKGTAISESIQYNADGKVVARTVSTPRASDKIKALDLAWKARGHYERVKQKQIAELEEDPDYQRLCRDLERGLLRSQARRQAEDAEIVEEQEGENRCESSKRDLGEPICS